MKLVQGGRPGLEGSSGSFYGLQGAFSCLQALLVLLPSRKTHTFNTCRKIIFLFFPVSSSSNTESCLYLFGNQRFCLHHLVFVDTFSHFEQENCTSFSGVKDKLDVGLSPNRHVGSIPVIQFGNLPASKSASLSSNRLVGKIYVSLTLNSNLSLFVIHRL